LPVLNDFLQYWLGAYTYIDGGGTNADGATYPLTGIADPFTGWDATTLDDGQDHTASFLPTSASCHRHSSRGSDRVRPRSTGRDRAPRRSDRTPATGSCSVGQADESYKRLTRTVDLTAATAGRLEFVTSYETEGNSDYLFVEAHEVGSDDWTTLPDLNGHTNTDTGLSRPEGWNELHPFLDHYQTKQGEECTATGTTGSWNAASESSAGSEEWAVDLSAYAGRQVEVSITYASDWGTQGIGVSWTTCRSPRMRVSSRRRPSRRTSAAGRSPGLRKARPRTSATGRAAGSRTRRARSQGQDTIYTGFGLEGLSAEKRADFVTRSMDYLIGASPVSPAVVPVNRR
jgi:hypothetical protein